MSLHNRMLQALRTCQECNLHQYNADNGWSGVPGIGNPDHPEVCFLGEAPGANEAKQAKPFVGRAGKLLTEILEELGKTRDEVWITNVVKHRPPDNRTPFLDERRACVQHFLIRELSIVRPRVIVCLGKTALEGLHLIQGEEPPKRGWRSHTFTFQNIPVLCTWHPAYVLRQPQRRSELLEDVSRAFHLL